MKREGFYVSCVNGSKTALVVGPFEDHSVALNLVDAVRSWAERHDPRAAFAAFGTARWEGEGEAPIGIWLALGPPSWKSDRDYLGRGFGTRTVAKKRRRA